MKVLAIIALGALMGCTSVRPVSIIGINSCEGFVGDLVILSDGRIIPRVPDDPETAGAIAKALGPGHSGMVTPETVCPPRLDTKYGPT